MRSRGPWLVFGVALVLVAAVMTWISLKLVGLERERIAAAQRAAHEESVRLALWRLDTAVTPMLSQEIGVLGLLAEAPIVAAELPRPNEVRSRFVADPRGVITSVGDTALPLTLPVAGLFARTDHDAVIGGGSGALANGTLRLVNPAAQEEVAQQAVDPGVANENYYSDRVQQQRNVAELSKRSASVDKNVASYASSLTRDAKVPRKGYAGKGYARTLDTDDVPRAEDSAAQPETDGDERAAEPIEGGPVRPMWIGDELVLVRQVRLGDGPVIHGSWLDWPALRDRLTAEVADTLPSATLVPVRLEHEPNDRLLATLPVRLDPGPPAELAINALGVLGPSLALGWFGLLAAALAVFALLRWSLALSERRASFVSAVTHELRTPLTTFRMYAEMLSENMVEPTKRARYVETLRREADRLGDLVENVLAYSRIEADKAPLNPEIVSVRSLLERSHERLHARADAAGLALRVDDSGVLADAEVRADPAAVEQILFNLVDNAAKYGPSEAKPRIEIDVTELGDRVAIAVRDFGPGIPSSERNAVFEPFAKALAQAAGTKPGVGLGLSLSRRLARQLGGDLTIDELGAHQRGARFVLTLHRANMLGNPRGNLR